MKIPNSRQMAKTWPYTRYKSFEASLRKAAEQWFSKRGANSLFHTPSRPSVNASLRP